LEKRLREELRNKGDFSRVHPLPQTNADVPDDMDARLVVLGIDYPYSREQGSPAETAARSILGFKGNTPRLFQNTLVFLAVDKTRLQDLDEAVRRYLAWESIIAEREALNLDPHQVKQADTQLKAADGTVAARLPEAYQWLLVPVQASPRDAVEWQAIRLSGSDALAARASKKLRNDELLVTSFAGTRLRMEMDKIPLWRGDHVAVQQLAEDFASYVYLPRLVGPEVLAGAVQSGLGLLTWPTESFAYADSYDETTARYRGLRCGESTQIGGTSLAGLLVRPEVAVRQREADAAKAAKQTGTTLGGQTIPTPTDGNGDQRDETNGGNGDGTGKPPRPAAPKRYHGTVTLDSTRTGRDAGRIADEVISHLVGLPGSRVKVTLEIEAEVPSGVSEDVVRIVTENGRALGFTSQGFEAE
ncbi:MAG: AAA+ family ATPase, partial [Chloroflexota bacterium]